MRYVSRRRTRASLIPRRTGSTCCMDLVAASKAQNDGEVAMEVRIQVRGRLVVEVAVGADVPLAVELLRRRSHGEQSSLRLPEQHLCARPR